jgi:hypothetical protein
MKLHLQTQVYENYAAHDWDGVGECPEYWKAKGGNDYFVLNVSTVSEAHEIMLDIRAQVEENSMYFSEHIIGWDLVENDFRTEFEQDQLDYVGKIDYPTQVLSKFAVA